MAKDPRKKKRKETPQTRVKRQQAAHKRRRVHGEFASGSTARLGGLFHASAASYARGPRRYSNDPIKHDPDNVPVFRHDPEAEGPQGEQQEKLLDVKPTKKDESRIKWDKESGQYVLPPNPSAGERERVKNANKELGSRRKRDEFVKGVEERRRAKLSGVPKPGEPERRGDIAEGPNEGPGKFSSGPTVHQEGSNKRSTRTGTEGTTKFQRAIAQDRENSPFRDMYAPENIEEASPQETRVGANADDPFDRHVESRPENDMSRDWVPSQLDTYSQVYSQLRAGNATEEEADRRAKRIAFDATQAKFGMASSIESMTAALSPTKYRRERPEEIYGTGGTINPDTGKPYPAGRVETERLWETHRGSQYGRAKPAEDSPLVMNRGKKRPQPNEIFETLPPSQQQWITQQMQDPSSLFYGADKAVGSAKQNLDDYLALTHDNYASNEIRMWMQEGKPAILPKGANKNRLTEHNMRQSALEDMQDRLNPQKNATTMKDKYDSSVSHSDFAYSKRTPGVDSLEDLRKRFPTMSKNDLVTYQHAQLQNIDEYMLQANERWAHERRSARVRGKGSGSNIEDEDRVVFFTTNVGAPAASVPANSLVGQYIIKKRKKMAVEDKVATRPSVKGEFPRAVRDQHLIEISTGLSLGVQGRAGLFHNTGWKVGSKRSKGYGKKAPVGAQQLRDSSGQPIYDKDGNVRYTEGYTRAFGAGTDRDVGLRVFIG